MTFNFEAIGTHWTIEYSGLHDIAMERAILNRVEVFDQTYSRFRPDSLISKIAASEGTYVFPQDAVGLFAVYAKAEEATNGLVTPLAGESLANAGYDKNYTFSPKANTVIDPDITLTYKLNELTVTKPAILDFGAAGKGYLVDIIFDLIKRANKTEIIVNAGGDIRIFTEHGDGVQFALEHPEYRDQAVGVVALHTGALCGSSVHIRKWGAFNHVINPKTGVSPSHLQAVWVTSSSAVIADIVSTALFFCDPTRLSNYFEFEYAIINEDYTARQSSEFGATLFSEGDTT